MHVHFIHRVHRLGFPIVYNKYFITSCSFRRCCVNDLLDVENNDASHDCYIAIGRPQITSMTTHYCVLAHGNPIRTLPTFFHFLRIPNTYTEFECAHDLCVQSYHMEHRYLCHVNVETCWLQNIIPISFRFLQ